MNRTIPEDNPITSPLPRERESGRMTLRDSRFCGNDASPVFQSSLNGQARSAALHAQKGVGLIEVLVAVLVLSIGLLGLAQLQAKSLSTNGSAMTRSMATMFSYSI